MKTIGKLAILVVMLTIVSSFILQVKTPSAFAKDISPVRVHKHLTPSSCYVYILYNNNNNNICYGAGYHGVYIQNVNSVSANADAWILYYTSSYKRQCSIQAGDVYFFGYGYTNVLVTQVYGGSTQGYPSCFS